MTGSSSACDRERQARGVAPQIFHRVEGPLVAAEKMHDHVAEIRDDPLAHGKAVGGRGFHAVFLFQPPLEIADQRLEMRLRGARSDDKEIRERRDAAQIEGDELFGLLVVEDDGAGAGEVLGIQGWAPW